MLCAPVPAGDEEAADASGNSSCGAAPGGEGEDKASALRPSSVADEPRADDKAAADEDGDEEEEAATSTQLHDDLDPFTGRGGLPPPFNRSCWLSSSLCSSS